MAIWHRFPEEVGANSAATVCLSPVFTQTQSFNRSSLDYLRERSLQLNGHDHLFLSLTRSDTSEWNSTFYSASAIMIDFHYIPESLPE